MRVSEIMTQAAVIDQPDDTLGEAARKMWEQQTGSLLVMDGEDLVGIITERDVLKAAATGASMDDTRISQVMSKDLVTVGPGTSLREAAKVMADRWPEPLAVGRAPGVLEKRDRSVRHDHAGESVAHRPRRPGAAGDGHPGQDRRPLQDPSFARSPRPLLEGVGVEHDLRLDELGAGVDLLLQPGQRGRRRKRRVGDANEVAGRFFDVSAGE